MAEEVSEEESEEAGEEEEEDGEEESSGELVPVVGSARPFALKQTSLVVRAGRRSARAAKGAGTTTGEDTVPRNACAGGHVVVVIAEGR